jgi:hypothetical protein
MTTVIRPNRIRDTRENPIARVPLNNLERTELDKLPQKVSFGLDIPMPI